MSSTVEKYSSSGGLIVSNPCSLSQCTMTKSLMTEHNPDGVKMRKAGERAGRAASPGRRWNHGLRCAAKQSGQAFVRKSGRGLTSFSRIDEESGMVLLDTTDTITDE